MRVPRLFFLLFLFTIWCIPLDAQSTYPKLSLHGGQPGVHAFVNCTLVTAPGKVIEEGVLIVREGRVENAGRKLKVPADAAVHDLDGAWVFPGLIDPNSSFGVPPVPKKRSGNTGPQYLSNRQGPYAWNEAVKPEYQIAEGLVAKAKDRETWRGMGFTTVNATPNDGIFRGQAAVVNLGEGLAPEQILESSGLHCLSFNKGSSQQAYPNSLMGSIALIRQTLYDADWYRQASKGNPNAANVVESNLSLEALREIVQAPQPIFECQNLNDLFRAARIGEEFGLKFAYQTKGDEYQHIEAVRTLDAHLIVPLSFPKAYDVSDPVAAREVSLRQMMHWEQAPLNAAVLARNKVDFSLTTHGLKQPEKEFWPALRKAIEHGLSEEDALAALTVRPARLIGMDQVMGTLDPGMMANFIVADQNPFQEDKAVVHETWVAGKRYVNQARPETKIAGIWNLNIGDRSYRLLVGGTPNAPTAKVAEAVDTLSAKVSLEGWQISFLIPESKSPSAGKTRLVGMVDGKSMSGRGETSEGEARRWSAVWESEWDGEKDKKPKEGPELADIPQPNYPFGPFGFVEPPKEQPVLIRNATVWTNTGQGILEKADVLILNGKISEVGTGLRPPGNAQVIDGTGKHLTPGIIDEHSHIGIERGVNEGTHNVTAEVRIGDVIDPSDVNIYRQLAGGVTTSQLLHGSANPIGGQSAIVKLRWGALAEDMKFAEAPGFIKFALGENVKQSNWGENYQSRYPQTRMGVEQLIVDAFAAAVEYGVAKEKKSQGLGSNLPIRQDLQKECLLEILDSKRFVTCHSYVQSEITMLMRLAEKFGFRINTFTHVLEGYKIADKLHEHGASGSTFSDWWAYKFEVIDAIPYNAALMASQGINVCINSDDAEMGRRLNQEAAKAVLYGGMSEEEALKLVTLNPAKALRIDDHVGSIEPGKHGDLVLWTDHPLSVYARVQQTYIDGRCYYDADRNERLEQVIEQERRRLMKKLLEEGKGGATSPPSSKGKRLYHCDTIESDYNHE